MIVYLDASVLVKRYIDELGTAEVNALIVEADFSVTNLISRAEVAAAIMRASRMDIINREEALDATKKFSSEWESIQRLPVTEAIVVQAENLVMNYDFRGYDAVHLAAALLWQEAIGEPVTLATFDNKLHEAAIQADLKAWPDSLHSL
jgi:predicted nucleic acid-binding protein